MHTLVIADHKGHILERIARSWINYTPHIDQSLLVSSGVSNYSLCRAATKFDLYFWVDRIRFSTCAHIIPLPQAVMIHHLTPDIIPSSITKLYYADAIITASEMWKRKLEQLTGRTIWLAPYSVDTTVFQPKPERDILRINAELKDDDFVIGFVGKAGADHAGRKGVDLLTKILVEANKCWPNIVALLVGPGWEPLKTTLETHGIRTKRYEFKTTEETLSAYTMMDVLLVTSSEEGGPCTILEAMACQVPVITSLVGHVPEIIVDGKTGFICSQRTVEEYIAKLKVLYQDAMKYTSIIQDARNFIATHRDDRVVISRIPFQEIYTEALTWYAGRSWLDRCARITHKPHLFLRHMVRTILSS